MQDKELYQTIRGLSTAWQVADVELDVGQDEIRVSVEHPRGVKFCCPESRRLLARSIFGSAVLKTKRKHKRHASTKSITTNLIRPRRGVTTKYFNDWYKRVIHTNLEPMKTLAKTIKEQLKNVVSFCTHKITNAVDEEMNSKIISIKRRVGGFRNIQNFKTAIFFYCGGLDLDPR